MILDRLIKDVKERQQKRVKIRRYLHEHPELTSEEVETSNFLKEEIRKLNLEIVEVEGTGFYAILDTKKPGKTIGLRTDIDALPVMENEKNLAGPRQCISKIPGKMHACGHDAHMSMLLSTAEILVKNKDLLQGRVIFIFEEGEELGTGIDAMVKALKKENIDGFYGCHVTNFLKTGEMVFQGGPLMAGSNGVDIVIRGRGGHGSRPDLSISPIFAAAAVVNNLASAWVNQLDVTKTVTLGLGKISGGTIRNVIPDEVTIEGTLRYFDEEAGDHAMEVVKHVAENTAKTFHCQAILGKENKTIVRPVINDEDLATLAQEALAEHIPHMITDQQPWFASESFSGYRQLAPALFAFVGIANDEVGSGAEHHNEYFDIDEEAMYYGTLAEVLFAYNFLQ